MLEREGGASEERSSSWETERAPENGDPLLIGVVSSIPDLTHTVHPFFRPVLAGLGSRKQSLKCRPTSP